MNPILKYSGILYTLLILSFMVGALFYLHIWVSNIKINPTSASHAEIAGYLALQMLPTQIALEKYKKNHDMYPSKLVELIPDYLAVVPKDLIANSTVSYIPNDKEGYKLCVNLSTQESFCGNENATLESKSFKDYPSSQ